jgi:ribonucleoside-diphosphate reductase beta chain
LTVFNNKKATLDRQMFLDPDGGVGIQRYDVVRYPILLKLTKQMNSFFWLPDEVDCTKDGRDFRNLLVPHEQRIITKVIGRAVLLDSVQGRAPAQVLGPICSVPEAEAAITTWTAFEQIHSMSYTHIIQGIYPNPTEILDAIMDDALIVETADEISKYYDALDKFNKHQDLFQGKSGAGIVGMNNPYEHKKALWLCLNAINALEGIRFYVAFACSWAFAELKKMEGTAKIIKLIARDENIHLAITQNMLKILPRDDPDFVKIHEETAPEVLDIFMKVISQEKEFAKDLFSEGSIIGLNYSLLSEYVEWIAHKRMINIGVQSPFKPGSNPLPWTQKWISGENVQVAPQETESTLYIQGMKKDLNQQSLASFKL